MANLPKIPNLNDLKNMADSSGILTKAKAMFETITSSIGGVPTPLSEEALADPVRAKLYECELLLQQVKDGQIVHMKLINNLDAALSQLNKLITAPKSEPTPTEKKDEIKSDENEIKMARVDTVEEKTFDETKHTAEIEILEDKPKPEEK